MSRKEGKSQGTVLRGPSTQSQAPALEFIKQWNVWLILAKVCLWGLCPCAEWAGCGHVMKAAQPTRPQIETVRLGDAMVSSPREVTCVVDR